MKTSSRRVRSSDPSGTKTADRRGTRTRPAKGKKTVPRGRSRVSGSARGNRSARRKASAAAGSSGKGILQQGTEQNRLSLFMAILVAVVLMTAVGINGVSLVRRLRENESRIQTLRQEIDAEKERAEDIEEYRRYTKTDAYIEEIAREKLGLIYEGETVFKEDK